MCGAVLGHVGAGKKGAEVRAHFESAPYGWPSDAVNGALAVLTLHGRIRASRDGQAVEAKDLDPRGINHVRFQAEDVVISHPERMRIAGLFQNAGVTSRPADVHLHVGEFLMALRSMAGRAGGEPPLPTPPTPPVLGEIEGLAGNAQLKRLFDEHNALNALMSEWGTLADRRDPRLAEWGRIRRAPRRR